MFFCGKGGVGKTVLAAACARKLARRAKVLLTSMTSTSYLEDLFGVELSGQRASAQKNLDLLRLDARKVMDDFIRRKIPLASYITKHPIYHTIINATPGLQEVLTLTTIDIFYHSRKDGSYEYDFLVVDALSTGHMKALLSSPQKAMEMIPSGGLHDIAQDVEQVFHDPKNMQVVIVTTPEEMPVNETVELARYAEEQRVRCDTVIANQILPPLMHEDAWALFRKVKDRKELWKEAEQAMQSAGFPFELPARLFQALSDYEQSFLEQREHLQTLAKLLPDKEIISIPLLTKAGKQLLEWVERFGF